MTPEQIEALILRELQRQCGEARRLITVEQAASLPGFTLEVNIDVRALALALHQEMGK